MVFDKPSDKSDHELVYMTITRLVRQDANLGAVSAPAPLKKQPHGIYPEKDDEDKTAEEAPTAAADTKPATAPEATESADTTKAEEADTKPAAKEGEGEGSNSLLGGFFGGKKKTKKRKSSKKKTKKKRKGKRKGGTKKLNTTHKK